MSRNHTCSADQAWTVHRFLAVIVAAPVFVVAARAAGLPGICALGPALGMGQLASWWATGRPEVPRRRWALTALAYFVVAPVVTYFVWRAFE